MKKQQAYRLHTENKNLEWIQDLVKIKGVDATFYYPDGLFEGTLEKSLDILFYTSNANLIRAIGREIKEYNNQKEVWLREETVYLEVL